MLQKNADFILDARPRAADVALLYNPENQVFGWAATGNEKNVTDSLLGVHRALYERNFVVDLIHPREFPGVLDSYRVIFVPFPYCLSGDICAALQDMGRGGRVADRGELLRWVASGGRPSPDDRPGLRNGQSIRGSQQTATDGAIPGATEITVKKTLRYIRTGQKVRGAIVREVLRPAHAEVWGTYANGDPAITSAACNKGRAILIGSFVGLPYYRGGAAKNGDLIAGLADLVASPDRPTVTGGKIRIDLLTDPRGSAMIVLRNLEAARRDFVFDVPGLRKGKAVEQFSGKTLQLKGKDGGVSARLTLEAGEVRVYRV